MKLGVLLYLYCFHRAAIVTQFFYPLLLAEKPVPGPGDRFLYLPGERPVLPCCLPHCVLLQLLPGAAGPDQRPVHVHAVPAVAEFRRGAFRRVEEEQKTGHPARGGRGRGLRVPLVPHTGECGRCRVN